MTRLLILALLAVAMTLPFRAPAQEEVPVLPETAEAGAPAEKPDSTAAGTPETPPAPAMTPTPAVSPVDTDDDKPTQVLHYYDKHGNKLEEPIRFIAVLDTVTKAKSGPVYPAYNGFEIGVNFGDAIFAAFGQKYGSYDVWADVSIHNWLFPIVECGLGYISDTPERQNFTYRCRPSFYAKAGLNYNFIYKSNPDYRFYAGLRAGMSRFTYDVTDISIDSGYWEEDRCFNLKGLKSTAVFGELLLGLQVRIVSGFSLGWTVRWHFRWHTSEDKGNRPWFIPGIGTDGPFAMTVNAAWTFGRKSPKTNAGDTSPGSP